MVLGSVMPGGPLMTCVQPEESVICWSLRWGGGFLRRVMVCFLRSREVLSASKGLEGRRRDAQRHQRMISENIFINK